MVRSLSACALVTVMSFSLLAQNTAPQVTVWVYRPDVDNISSAVPLYMDGHKVLNLGHGRFFGIQVPPGLHAFNWTNQPGAKQVVVPVGADPQAYFEVTFNSGFPFLSMNPLPVDKAMQAMVGMQPVDPNGVFDSGVMIPAQPLQAAFKPLSADSANTAKPAPVSVSAPVSVPTRVSVPAPQSVAVASAPQIPSSTAVNLREKTPKREKAPKEDAAQNFQSKAEKETVWVTALARESDPPQQHRFPLFRSFMDKVQAEGGRIYTISCRANWIVSDCGPMIDGDSFKAEVAKKTMWITAHKDGNLWEDVRIRYKIVDIQ
jgi:hypothetical protein